MKVLFSIGIILIAFLSLYTYGDSMNKSCTPEETACRIFKENIFKKLYADDKSSDFIVDENHEVINSFLDDYKKGLVNIYNEGKSGSNYSKPYMDSVALFLAISDESISQWEIDELKELYQDYQKSTSRFNDNDCNPICEMKDFNSSDDINQAKEVNRNDYFIKLNKHIRSNSTIYVQIEIHNYYNEGFDVYVVLNGSDNSFLRYFINRF